MADNLVQMLDNLSGALPPRKAIERMAQLDSAIGYPALNCLSTSPGVLARIPLPSDARGAGGHRP